MDKSSFNGSDPKTSIVVTEEFIGIDVMIAKDSIRFARIKNRVRLGLVADEVHEPPAAYGKQWTSVVGSCQGSDFD
jgi:hypothetical protein